MHSAATEQILLVPRSQVSGLAQRLGAALAPSETLQGGGAEHSMVSHRIQKIMADAGICSRRDAEELIARGLVRMNGEVATLGQNADPEKDEIMYQGKRIRPSRKIYIILHKPRGYITTAEDPWGRKHVTDLIHEQARLYPVGRLDKDASGLLLLTNDGDWANKVLHPRYEVPRTYEVTLDRKITPEEVKRIHEGIEVDGHLIQAKVTILAPKRAKITVHTGIHKEVKRIFKEVGFWVEALRRTEMGGILLGNLKEGKYRHLNQVEIKRAVEPRETKGRPPRVARHAPSPSREKHLAKEAGTYVPRRLPRKNLGRRPTRRS